MSRQAFGPNLRRMRVKKGISIERISAETKIPVEWLNELENNDFSRWPLGIFARAYVRQYAFPGKKLAKIELDPDGRLVDINRTNNIWPKSAPPTRITP